VEGRNINGGRDLSTMIEKKKPNKGKFSRCSRNRSRRGAETSQMHKGKVKKSLVLIEN